MSSDFSVQPVTSSDEVSAVAPYPAPSKILATSFELRTYSAACERFASPHFPSRPVSLHHFQMMSRWDAIFQGMARGLLTGLIRHAR